MTDTVAVAETSAIHRISTQLCQRTHSVHLPELFRGLTFCKCHHVEERCVLLHWHKYCVLRCHVCSDPQGVRYLYLYITETTISLFKDTLRVRGGRNCQNDEAKEKKLHAGIYRRLSGFGMMWTATDSGSGATLNMRAYLVPYLSVFLALFFCRLW